MTDVFSQPYYSGFDPLPVEVEARVMPEAKPQAFNLHDRDDVLVICVHGFTGTPYEVLPAAKAIANDGIPTVVPLLPGHGFRDRPDQEREFARITPEGMRDAVRQEITRAREHYSRVGIVGFSMGGAIALSMAAEGLLDVCAVVAPAIRLPLRGEILIPLLGWASFTLPAPCDEPFHLPNYQFHHSWALRTLWQLGCHARRNLSQVQCPVLGIHSHNDAVVPPVVLDLMQSCISAPIETQWFDESGHSMLLDRSGPQVASAVADFMQRQLMT